MGSAIRIFGVWLTALGIASLIGEAQAFLFVFVLMGFFLTLPALVILLAARAIESQMHKAAGPFAASWVGVVLGLIVPAGLYAIAPNPENAMQALTFLAPLSLGTGILWLLSSIFVLFPRRNTAA